MMKQTIALTVACLAFFSSAEKVEAASLAEILGVIANDIIVDGTKVDIGDINLFSNNNNGNGSGHQGSGGSGGTQPPATQPAQPTTVNNYFGPVVNNNYFGTVVNNFFSGPTFNINPFLGGGGGVQPPSFGNNPFLPIFNPIIIIGPVNINITINITIFNGPVSIARSGGF